MKVYHTDLHSFLKMSAYLISLQSPQFKKEGDKDVPETFAEQARFYTECRLLQREVTVTLEGVTNQLVYGTISHPVIIVPNFL